MTCCIVGLLILSLVNRARRLIGGRVDEGVLFAPVARRPAAGETLGDAAPPAIPAARPVPSPRSPVLRYCAIAIAIAALGYPLLVHTGVVDNTGTPLAWAVRSGIYAAAVVAAVVLSRSKPIWSAQSGIGTLLVVTGAVTSELGVLDMHVFRVVAVDSSNILALMVFHNIGPVLVAVTV